LGDDVVQKKPGRGSPAIASPRNPAAPLPATVTRRAVLEMTRWASRIVAEGHWSVHLLWGRTF